MKKNKKVVIIEPTGIPRMILELQFQLEKYQVVTYCDHEEALAKLPQIGLAPDCIIVALHPFRALPDILVGIHACIPSATLIVLLPQKQQQEPLVERMIRTTKATIFFQSFPVSQLFTFLVDENPLRV